MRISDGATAALAAVVVTGLAAALGFGVHAVIGELNTDDDSSPGPASSPMGTEDDLCDLMAGMLAYTESFNESQASTNALLNGDTLEEEEFIEALHTVGQAIIDGSRGVAEYFGRAVDVVTEPEIVEAFETLAYAQEELGRVQGEIILGIGSMDEYWALALETDVDPEILSLLEEGEDAILIVQPYVYDSCGINVLIISTSIATSLKADASTLGREVPAFFTDADAPPVATEDSDTFYLNGYRIGPRSPGVALYEQQFTDPSDWCVSVYSPDFPSMVYNYSAQLGLTEGACSFL